MSQYRANKSGFAAEAQKKIESNFDQGEATKCLHWIQQVSGEESIPDSVDAIDSSPDEFHTLLHDGMVLCRLMDKLMPGKVNWKDKTFQVPKIEAMKIMRERERISMFGKLVQEFGVADTYTFPTESLHEKGALNLNQVCVCLRALGIEAQNKGIGPDGYWPKKTGKNVREFSEEQLRAGAGVIGLQMGSNKGASQAGMNMGKGRKILD
eukprot:GHVU01139748.1.p1 GENE.GHVU01139748.1~~GHVU01139748.1.p1  ORF type:complete len:209 (-),score=24.63 GHVU01139748.1:228-854(-)